MYFEFDGKLPSLNDYVRACRSSPRKGNEFKKDTEQALGWYILLAKGRGQIQPMSEPVEISIEWHESTKKRDVDNIQSAQKFILDALTGYGILKDDSRKYVKQIHHTVFDDRRDFVKVILTPTE